MNDRERWTVYPLLFFVLAIALRGKFSGTIDSPVVSCRELIVRGAQGGGVRIEASGAAGKISLVAADARPRLQLDAAGAGAGRMIVYGDDQSQRVLIEGSGSHPAGKISLLLSAAGSQRRIVELGANPGYPSGMLETFAADGHSQVIVTSGATGGAIETIRRDGGLAILLGHQVEQSGVFSVKLDGKQLILTPLAK